MSKKILLSSILWTLTAGGQIAAAWLLYDPAANTTRINMGWLIIFVSGIFGWLPIFTFRSRGNIQGRSYIDTTTLVDSGIYRFVRHPQYLAGLLINIGAALITWHWLVILLGLLSVIMYYWSTFIEEEKNLEKFGDDYRDYQKRVPRFNFLLGLFRVLEKKENKDG
jgi:protein-S-isoprenylcysteine O-methyltransferase Ste14